MRKLLMAATAVVGAVGLAAAAHAQAPESGYMPGLGGDPNIFGMTSGVPSGTALPGSMQIYFRGRLTTEWGASGTNINNVGGNKNGSIIFGDYARFYSGFAGTAANGMQYGATFEVRQDFYSGLGAKVGDNDLHFRRETAYIKGPWGQFRAGQTDPATGLFMTGTFENFTGSGDGSWNGDQPGWFEGNAQISWPFPEDSGLYGTGKVVYLSPSFSGFDFGVSYEPNDSNLSPQNPGAPSVSSCASALSGYTACPNATTITGAGTAQYRRNMFDAVGRYQGKLGPVAVTGALGMMTAGHVTNATAPASNPTVIWTGWTFAANGFAIGGNFITGNSGASGSGVVPELKGAPHEMAYTIGTSYAFGPFIVGASYLGEHQAANYNGTTVKHASSEQGINVGGTYYWAPGSQLFVSWLWGTRHQAGYDFATSTAGSSVGNSTRASGILIGNQFDW